MNEPHGAVLGLPSIQFENMGHYSGLEIACLRRWLVPVVQELAPNADTFAVCLASDRRIRQLNRDFRGIDEATDVLSFPGEETPEGFHLGDLAISIPTARRQARSLGHGLQKELRELTLHGLLHCLGMDHENDDGQMDRREVELRQRWIGEDRA